MITIDTEIEKLAGIVDSEVNTISKYTTLSTGASDAFDTLNTSIKNIIEELKMPETWDDNISSEVGGNIQAAMSKMIEDYSEQVTSTIDGTSGVLNALKGEIDTYINTVKEYNNLEKLRSDAITQKAELENHLDSTSDGKYADPNRDYRSEIKQLEDLIKSYGDRMNEIEKNLDTLKGNCEAAKKAVQDLLKKIQFSQSEGISGSASAILTETSSSEAQRVTSKELRNILTMYYEKEDPSRTHEEIVELVNKDMTNITIGDTITIGNKTYEVRLPMNDEEASDSGAENTQIPYISPKVETTDGVTTTTYYKLDGTAERVANTSAETGKLLSVTVLQEDGTTPKIVHVYGENGKISHSNEFYPGSDVVKQLTYFDDNGDVRLQYNYDKYGNLTDKPDETSTDNSAASSSLM